MARRKSKFKPRDFEKDGNSNLSATIYASMMQSKAWGNLTNNARVLYLNMKLQLYGQASIEGYDQDCFVFNKGMYMNTYGLYKTWAQFNRDISLLIENGFIEVVECGKNTRTKNIYRYSDKWKQVR